MKISWYSELNSVRKFNPKEVEEGPYHRYLYFGRNAYRDGTHRQDGPSFLGIWGKDKIKLWYVNEEPVTVGVYSITYPNEKEADRFIQEAIPAWAERNDIDPLDMSEEEILMMYSYFKD